MSHQSNFDLIGDIHGQFDALSKILGTLGYRCNDGRWSHPNDHHLIFLGDLIDRGPKNREVVNTVRALVDQRVATCLMGNHEFNAVQYHTPDGAGGFLRDREKKRDQHQDFLEEYEGCPDEWASVIQWFSSLPVSIETPHFRAIHACWSAEHLKNLRHENGAWHMPDTPWLDAAEKGTDMYNAVEILMKGPEKQLPKGLFTQDKHGNKRYEARLAWWKKRPRTWAEAVVRSVKVKGLHLHSWDGGFHSYAAGEKPVFFGHYSLPASRILESHNAVCLDYLNEGGRHITAYRFSSDSLELNPVNIVQVEANSLKTIQHT